MTKEKHNYKMKSLQKEVFKAARDGHEEKIMKLLSSQENENIVNDALSHQTFHKEQNTTPLIIAARNGHCATVREILSLSVKVDQTGMVKFQHKTAKGATALWCAARAGHINIVKLLIRSGAQVNYTSECNTTPLLASCYYGRLDIVKYLTDNGADIDIPNMDQCTSLMIACEKKHTGIIDFLVNRGANLNSSDRWGATALHRAAKSDNVQIVKLLIKNGAKSKLDEHKLSPLAAAAVHGKENVVEYLISLSDCSRKDTIDALELLATSYAGISFYGIQKAYNNLQRAMKERYKDKSDIIEKPVQHPIAAYDHWVERKTLCELNAIKSDPDAMLLECLTIRQRLLVPTHPMVPNTIIYSAVTFANRTKYDKCNKLISHAIALTKNTKNTICFPEVFAEMLYREIHVNFKATMDVFAFLVNSVNFHATHGMAHAEDMYELRTDNDVQIIACVCLIGILLRIRKTEEEGEEMQKAICKFVEINPKLSNGYTLLHMCCDRYMCKDYNQMLRIMIKFPSVTLCKVFLMGGANVNAQDNNNNTPLHLVIRSASKCTAFGPVYEIVETLCEYSAHADIYMYDSRNELETDNAHSFIKLLKSYSRINLACEAARAIKLHEVNYKGILPVRLQRFVDLH